MARGVVDILNRVFKVQLFFRLRQAQMQTTFHLRDAGAPTSTVSDVLSDAINWMQTEWRPCIASSINITKVAVTRLDEGSFEQAEFVGLVGANGQPQTSTMLSATISLKSAYRDRSANGRMFWPGCGDIKADLFDAPVFQALNTAAAAMQTRYCGPPLTSLRKLVIVSYPKKVGTPPAFPVPMPPTKWADVDIVRVQPIVTSLRSRKSGVGS